MPKPRTNRIHHAAIFALFLFVMTLVTSVEVKAQVGTAGGSMQQVVVTGKRMTAAEKAAFDAEGKTIEFDSTPCPDGQVNSGYGCMTLPTANTNPIQIEPLTPMANPRTSAAAGDSNLSEDESSCAHEQKMAANVCLVPGAGDMEPGEAAMYTMLANQLTSSIAQVASVGKNAGAQCSLQANIQKTMAAINGVKGFACGALVKKCKSACDNEAQNYTKQAAANADDPPLAAEEKKKAAAAKKLMNRCDGYTVQVMQMMAGAMQSMGAFAANKQCASDFAAFNAAAPTYTPIAMPSVGDCSDPNNQSLTCYCQKDANKASAMCAGFNPGNTALNGGSTTTTPNGSTVTSPYSSTTDNPGDTTDPFAGGPGGKTAGGDGKGMGDGGSGAPGGGNLSAFGSEGGGPGGGGDPRSAITGTSGGTGSGLGAAGGGGGAGGGLARNNAAAKGEGFLDKFNLKRFLPGSKFKARGIAGMSVKSVDGITGPMGPSIWEKATRQYQEQIQKQNVILDK